MTKVFGNFQTDLWFFCAPGVLAGLVSLVLHSQGMDTRMTLVASVYAFIASQLLDTGHVYVTVFRLFKDSREMRIYGALFVGVVLAMFLWMFLGIPHYFSFVVYFTFYHHIRQYYGIFRIYDHGRTKPWAPEIYALYALLLLPFLALHLRTVPLEGLYTGNDLFIYPSATLANLCILSWLFVLILSMGLELRRARRGDTDLGRLIAYFYPVTLQAACMFLGRNLFEAIFPLLISHAVSYIGLVAHSLKRNPQTQFNWKFAVIAVFFTSFLFGTLEHFWSEAYMEFNYESQSISWLAMLATAFGLGPNVWHFIVDGFIWRRSHSSFQYLW